MRFQQSVAAVAILSVVAACTMTQSARLMTRPDGTRLIEVVSADPPDTTLVTRARNDEIARGFEGIVNHDPLHAPVPVPRNLMRELTSLRDCLLEGWPHPTTPPDLVVSSNLAPGAEAVPGRVTLYTGLLADESMTGGQVAFVLAHELAHTLLGHYNRVEFQEGQKEAMGALTSAGVLAAVAAATEFNSVGGQVTAGVADQAGLQDQLVYIALAAQASQILLDGVIESSWSRDQEVEADLLGVDLITNAGIFYTNGPGALRVLERYQQNRKTKLELYKKEADQEMEAAFATLNVQNITQTFGKVMAGAVVTGFQDLYDYVQRSSISATARIESLGDYNGEIYEGSGVEPFVVGRTCDVARLDRLLERDPLQSVYDALFAAEQARSALLDKDLGAAQRHIRTALRGPVSRHPVPRFAAYHVAKARGDDRAAIDHLRRIRRNSETPIAVYTGLGLALLTNERPVEARQILVEGGDHYPRDTFYPLLLQTAYARDDQNDIERIEASCAASTYDDVKQACRRITRGLDTDNTDNGPAGAISNFLEDLRNAGQQLTN